MASAKLTIFLCGMIASDPGQGGATWAVLQYWLGLERLGHRVFFVEPIQRAALRPSGIEFEASANARYFRRVAREIGRADCAALVLAGTTRTVGIGYESLRAAARRADVLINISGLLQDEALRDPIPVRAYLDLDPGFTQLWHAVQGIDMRYDGHTHFLTIGPAIGHPDSTVPDCDRRWTATRPPSVLERWPMADHAPEGQALTTVGNWRSYGSIHHQGIHYGQKVHSMRGYLALPSQTGADFGLALAIDPGESGDLRALAKHGWRLVDPARVAATPARYRRFIRNSWAEFAIAKSGYVASRCGWFSDRSVCYLASGRPVIAQETGFSRFLPTGAGLFGFRTEADVGAAIEELRRDYPRHARAARALAEEYFDSDKILPGMLRAIGAIA